MKFKVFITLLDPKTGDTAEMASSPSRTRYDIEAASWDAAWEKLDIQQAKGVVTGGCQLTAIRLEEVEDGA